MVLNGNYNFKEAEKRILKYWEANNIFKFDDKSKKPIYSIDTPPPTVSGKMHVGHAFSYSQQDFIARYKRMKDFNVFYPFGTDDNGLATERMIEKLKNVRSKEMKREEFVKLCLKTLDEIRPNFIQDWKNIGVSADYTLFYSTINDHCRRISQKSFIDLYNKERVYQKEAPTIWCPACRTAIAQAELEDKELESTFNDIIFKVDNKNLIISTTRPELLGSCVAVFIHPDDKKNKSWIGKKAKVPLFNNEVQILADKRVNPEKGTGAVMSCTFGDQTDIEWYKAYNLPLKISFTEDGRINELGGKYKGLKIKEAREKILEDLEKEKLLLNKKKITHIVNVHERCSTEIEIINTKQWFVKYLDLKELFLKEGSKLNWYPKHMKVRYDNWVKGLQWDWCISRQRHFGIPFPLWYCQKCKEIILADEKDLPVDPLTTKPNKKCKCGSSEFIPEKDVLDTWATSSLTPKIAQALTKIKIYPMSTRNQAHDIICTWQFYTMVKSQLHDEVNPWRDVVISGHVLDPDGNKMSKSKGNTVEPQVVMEKFGADAFRFWAAGSKLGDDMSYQEKDLVTGQKTVNKLWNATKFILQHLKDFDNKKPKQLEESDKFILSKLAKIIKDCTESFDKYEYSKTKFETENFFWNTFCDYYLEIVKDRVYNPNIRGVEQRKSAQYTLKKCLTTILKLFAPIIPYITEEIYLVLLAKQENSKSIHLSNWPEFNKEEIDDKIEKSGERVLEIIKLARQFKSKNNKSLKAEIDLVLEKTDEKLLKNMLSDLKSTVNAKTIAFGNFEIKFV